MPRPQLPALKTERLILRSLCLNDAPNIQKLAGDKEIAANTLLISHPYLDGMAEDWIYETKATYKEGLGVTFGIVIRESQTFCGTISLSICPEDCRGMLWYWIGKPYWSQDYCTEAGRCVLKYGFNTLKLNRIHAEHFISNPASGKVMQKLGMTYEGCLRQHILKWDEYKDLGVYGILKRDYNRISQLGT